MLTVYWVKRTKRKMRKSNEEEKRRKRESHDPKALLRMTAKERSESIGMESG